VSRVSATPYIEWAKQKKAAWNLAISGVPAPTLAEISRRPEEMPLSGDNHYGYGPLLERIAAKHRVAPSNVVTATGCSMANFLALAALVEPGDEVLIERPTYEPLQLAALHLGASVTRFERRPADAFGVDPDEVSARLSPKTRAVVLSNLHNPSSQLVSQDVLQRIGAAAERVGARVIVDEVYLDAVFDDTPSSCVHLGPPFVSTSSLTKVYGLSPLRCGWVLADDELARRIWRVNDLYENVRPFAPDWLAVGAFDHLPALRQRSRALLDTNRHLFTEWASARADFHYTLPPWGTTVCVRPTAIAAGRLCDELQASYDVSVVPGHFFELRDYIRIALCAPTAAMIEGLARLGRCLDAFRDHGD
jgi:aspartate/methionine/tyrosine aminotransferase